MGERHPIAQNFQIFQNFMQFFGKFGKIICWSTPAPPPPSPGGLAPSPTGNPVSAPEIEEELVALVN